ncbi:MAG: serine O-acetyltransferase [bacterium]
MFDGIRVVFEKDPAAGNIFEVLMYQGLWALWLHNAAHFLFRLRIPIIPRLISQISRLLTLIEIHPGARIGKRCFIDHGVGVVIGETSVIGNDVTIYQGVTLGGTGAERGRRHPTIGNSVVIGAEAIILGNIHIGNNARIGAGAVVTKSVPVNSTVVGNPARIVVLEGKKVETLAHGELPDPVGKALDEMSQRIAKLEQMLKK